MKNKDQEIGDLLALPSEWIKKEDKDIYKDQIKILIKGLLEMKEYSLESADDYRIGSPDNERCKARASAYKEAANLLETLIEETEDIIAIKRKGPPNKKEYFFHCGVSSDPMAEGEVFVTFVSKEFWIEEGCIEDRYLFKELDLAGMLHPQLAEAGRGAFTRRWDSEPLNVEKMNKELIEMGFVSDPDFHKWSKVHDPF